MNFVFISPNFPESYKIFADRLMRNGINVLGIGDAPYEALDEELRDALTEYYKVDNMEDYDSMYRAVAYFAFRYGKIDWIESNNEYWLRQDARLREDFNVTTGVQPQELALWQSKSAMKPVYKSAGIPTARNHKVSDIAAAEAFIDEIGGYPVFCKPDTGVGAEDTFKVEDHDDLEIFFRCKPDEPYVMEEFIVGDVYTYDAICDSNGEPLFESSLKCPNIADTVNSDQETLVMILPDVHPQIREYGRKALKEFKVKSRFVHFEFFRLKEPRKGLGDVLLEFRKQRITPVGMNRVIEIYGDELGLGHIFRPVQSGLVIHLPAEIRILVVVHVHRKALRCQLLYNRAIYRV
jgi:hypothetical protein